MGGNSFDIELRADDQVSGALKEISDHVKNLQPELTKTGEGLKLGGQDTQDDLTDINASFQSLSRFAKDNVQLIGDMVPPLRNFLGNAGNMGGMAMRFGLAGGAAYLAGKGIAAMGGGMADAASDAYQLQIAAENAGMSVKDLSQLSGAMRLLGSDSESARGSVEGLYKTFNDALQGRNSAGLAIMNQINAPIVRNADGTANVLKTVEKLAEVMPRLSPQNQKTVADALGLDANSLQLLREGANLKALLAKSDSVGLTVDPKINSDLVVLNRNINQVGASWDGLKQRIKQKIVGAILSDGSVNDGIKGVSDVMENGFNPISLGHAFGFNRGNDADLMRRAIKDKEFQKTLTATEMEHLVTGKMTDDDRAKYRVRYGLGDQASMLAGDMNAITRQPNSQVNSAPGSSSVDNSALSVRNNNPWNIRYAGQANAAPGVGGFARFDSPDAGVQAADRQLQLYATGKSKNVNRPLSTMSEIIRVASPPSDGNKTGDMIARASRQLGVRPDDSLNLTDTGMRSRVLAALFNQEGNNPYSSSQIEQIISVPKGQGLDGMQAPSITAPQNPPVPALVSQSPPSLVTPPPAVNQKAGSAEDIARAVSDALKENGMKLEVTLINPANGSRQTITGTGGSGGKVTAAMQFP